METNNDTVIRQHIADLIDGGNAHATFDDAIANLPPNLRGIQPQGLPYSIWQLVEHIRIAQWDILEFTKNTAHQSPKWPDDYWPKNAEPANSKAWDNAIEQIAKDREEFIALLNDASHNLYEPLPGGEGQTLLREALLIADHNSYHTSEIIVLRRLLGAWQK